ncbi:hypothetical protein ACJQWK_11893 [Exserohilum turcicum]
MRGKTPQQPPTSQTFLLQYQLRLQNLRLDNHAQYLNIQRQPCSTQTTTWLVSVLLINHLPRSRPMPRTTAITTCLLPHHPTTTCILVDPAAVCTRYGPGAALSLQGIATAIYLQSAPLYYLRYPRRATQAFFFLIRPR